MTGEIDRGLEAVKWVAFALMIADHVGAFLLNYEYPALYLLGRLVFPLFALALAAGLRNVGELVYWDVCKRLLMWAVVTQIPYSALQQGGSLNVMFTLWFGAFIYGTALYRRIGWIRGVLIFLGSVGMSLMEYGVVGVALVGLCCAGARAEGKCVRYAYWVPLTLLQAVNGVPVAMLGPGVFWLVRRYGELPRVRHAFYWLYPAQWVLIAAARVLR